MKKLRGFAAMSPERRRELQSKGGKARAANNPTFFFNSETGKEAGKKRWRVFIKKYGRKKMKKHLSRISRMRRLSNPKQLKK